MSDTKIDSIEATDLDSVTGGAATPSNAAEGPLSGWFTPIGSDGKPGTRIPIQTTIGHHARTGDQFTGQVSFGDAIGPKLNGHG
jgi:hypothetical protein